jgi:hypothetical protein
LGGLHRLLFFHGLHPPPLLLFAEFWRNSKELLLFGAGGQSPQGLLIGIAGTGEIIEFLQGGSIPLPAATAELIEGAGRETSVKLLDQGYGVTVIIPRPLAENKDMLRLAKVETD